MSDLLTDLHDPARRAELDVTMAGGRCKVYPSHPLPPGFNRPSARLGMEVDPATSDVLLHVESKDPAVDYSGPDSDLRRWCAGGTARFSSLDELASWAEPRLDLTSAATDPGVGASPTSSRPEVSRGADELTDLAEVVSIRTVPRQFVEAAELVALLEAEVRGQTAAVRSVANWSVNHLAKVEPTRPLNFWANGSSGVGKSSMARTLPRALTLLTSGDEPWELTQLDMAEYQEAHRVSQLLGSPQGYVAHGEGSHLTDDLRRNPRRVVLFDEIEKAHPDVRRALLNAMDTGRLTTASGGGRKGREVDCRQAIFIFTSNLDATGLIDDLDRAGAWDDEDKVNSIARAHLRSEAMPAEFVGRITSFLAFAPLSPQAQAEVAVLATERVCTAFGVTLDRVEPAIVTRLLLLGSDGQFGARPLEHVAERELAPAIVGVLRDLPGTVDRVRVRLSLAGDAVVAEVVDPVAS